MLTIMKKAYTKPTTCVMNVELEEMMIVPGSLGVGASTSSYDGTFTAESNNRYDYEEEDDEDLW